jgi:hypothetical protein
VPTHYCFSSGRVDEEEEDREEMKGRTALMWAALKGHVGVTRLLIAANAELEAEAW